MNNAFFFHQMFYDFKKRDNKLEPKTQYHQNSQKSENSKEMKRKQNKIASKSEYNWY